MAERDMPARVARPFVFLAKLLAWDREAWGKVWLLLIPPVRKYPARHPKPLPKTFVKHDPDGLTYHSIEEWDDWI